MALLNCPSCEGEGFVLRTYLDHVQKTIRQVFTSCPKCEPHGDEVYIPKNSETMLGVDEIINEYISKGYRKITN